MFRFSCFHSPALSPKPKKTVQLPTEAMGKILEDNNTNKPNKDPVFSKEVHESNNVNPFPCSACHDWKSEGLKSSNDTGSDTSEHGHEIRAMRKSVSLGTGLAAYQDITSREDSSSCHGNRSRDKYQKALDSVSAQMSSNLVNHASDLSPDHLQRSRSPCNPHTFVKSHSLPYLQLVHTNVVRQSRSSDDLKVLDTKWDDKQVHTDAVETLLDQEIEDYSVGHADRSDGDEAYDKGKSIQQDHSVYQYEELPGEDYKIKRIEKWVIDLQHSSSLEETNMLTDFDHDEQNGKGTILDPILASRNEAKAVLGMDAAKRYISSLNAAATTAQLANHGLVAIPFLSAFLSLRVLNLSGNSIVRITVGALPRGLHILNLSKNSISTIEGLRELTRLRILDLSYNRILRIGHGLALCSSLKELYMAGNKISEVEGLHRLLKLNVLDLRFNKLSTTKNLGQLAANYSSLQTISLEGNPAQKNIGDEQLKKFLLGLLPHIAYFNRHSIKSGGMKDAFDRAARLGISAHQTDRGVKLELKTSTHGRKSQVVNGRARHVRLPPSGVKARGDGQQFRDASSQLVSFSPDLAMRRTHSEGLLRAV